MKRKTFLFVTLAISLFLCNIQAQDNYKYEIGAMAGTSFYMGDANKTKLYQDPGLAGGIVFRYNKDLRWAVKSNFVMGHVSGNTQKSGNVFPLAQEASFSRFFYEIGSQIEFNFFNYSDQFAYLGTRRMSPYLFTGIGFTMASGKKTFFDANVPLGVGIKYKLKERLNLNIEFSFRKLFSDSFDVTDREDKFNLDRPYNISSSVLKNNDWYSLTMLSITWDFGLRVCPCLNRD